MSPPSDTREPAMPRSTMTPMERVLTAMDHKEPDRVPFFLLLTTHGAREMNMSIKDYFSNGQTVAEAQLRMREKYRHDCLLAFFHAPVEIGAWGGEVVYSDSGPPNSGRPFIDNPAEQVPRLKPPDIKSAAGLGEVLETTRILAEKAAGDIPVMGVVVSPFSLPVMQMGFSAYIELLCREPSLFWDLMAVNEAFCVEWANAQLAEGATAICYFDPVASPTIIPRSLYLETGHIVARRTIGRINGPTATHLASGATLQVADDIAQTGTGGIGVSAGEDLEALKRICKGKLTVIGNLNGLEMARWSREEAFSAVRHAIAQAGPGGGFILADNHGEIPWHVPEAVLSAVSEAVHRHGCYPIKT